MKRGALGGAGTLTLTADPSANNLFVVNGGVLALQHPGSTDAPFIVNNGGTLRVVNTNDLGDAYPVTLNAGGTLDLLPQDDLIYAVRTVVNQKGRISNFEVLLSDGEPLRVGGKSVSFLHEMRNSETGEIHSTCENVTVLFDLKARKAIPLDEAIRAAAQRLGLPVT